MRFMVTQEVVLKTASFERLETEHFVVKYLPPDREYIGTIINTAEQAYHSVTNKFGSEPDKKTMVIVYPTSSALAQSFGWDKDEKAMGVYWGGTIRLLSPAQWLTGGIEEKFFTEGPMHHEFTHLMVDEITNGNYNRWWTEGIAQYIEKQLTGFEFSNPFTDGQETHYYKLANLEKNFDNLEQQIAYWESLQVVEYIVHKYGEEKIFNILENLGKGDNMRIAIEKCLKINYHEFENNFYNSLQ